jgi:hypothetical protein
VATRGGPVRRLPALRTAAFSFGFGGGMAASYLAGWLALGRALSVQSVTAAAFIGLASVLSCGAAAIIAPRVGRRAWSARFAAALIVLICGTAAGSAVFLALATALAQHPLSELPLRIVLLVLAILSAASLYGFLSIAAWLILPLGLPLIVVAALVIARQR